MSEQPGTQAHDSNQEQQTTDSRSYMTCSQLSVQDNHIRIAPALDMAGHSRQQIAVDFTSTSAGQVASCAEPDIASEGQSDLQLGQQANTAHTPAVETDSMSHAAPYDGLLERVPGSCLRELLKSLPPASKQAVFGASRWLANLVMEASPNLTLKLCSIEHLTPTQTETRRKVLAELLSTQHRFQMALYPDTWQPFPTSLGDRITSLTLAMPAHPNKTCLDWACMPHLHTFTFTGYHMDEWHSIRLCEAAEAGQLQQLHTLRLPTCHEVEHAGRLITSLAPQLVHVETACRAVMENLHKCTALQSCTLRIWSVPATVMPQLCDHPTLKHLHLSCEVCGDHSQRNCSWDTLTMDCARLDDLARMPLTSVKQLHLRNDLWGSLHQGDGLKYNAQAVDGVFPQHIVKGIKVTPSVGQKFTLNFPCPAMIPVVERMHGVKRLHLSNKASHVSVLPLCYQVLPISVENIVITGCGFDFTELWQGLPEHVTTVEVRCHDNGVADVRTMVRTAPSHVELLVLIAIDSGEYNAWEAADLPAAASNHLHVELCMLRHHH